MSHSNNMDVDCSGDSVKRLVLVGGGHAHLQVLKAYHSKARPVDVDVWLLDPLECATYSGMIPGCVSGQYSISDANLPFKPLTDWANITYICAKVTNIDFDTQHVTFLPHNNNHTTTIPYNVISLDIGSTVRTLPSLTTDKTETAANNNHNPFVIPTRPISTFVHRLEQEENKWQHNVDGNVKDVYVVGGGAAGIELAMALRQRWGCYDDDVKITLVNSNAELLPNESQWCRSALEEQFNRLKIQIRHNTKVIQRSSSHTLQLIQHETTTKTTTTTTTTTEEEVSCHICIWATGASAHSLARINFASNGLSINPNGWINVNSKLQSLSHPQSVFAAGDCASIQMDDNTNKQIPKAGVYAVRAGPILIQNLISQLLQSQQKQKDIISSNDNEELVLSSELLTSYEPQDDFLKLLNCGDGTALGFRFGIPLYGKWVWQLKDHIDRLFLKSFHSSQLPDLQQQSKTTKEDYDTSQYDDNDINETILPTPKESSDYLLRTDDNVDYMLSWSIIRHMMKNDSYRNQVLKYAHDSHKKP